MEHGDGTEAISVIELLTEHFATEQAAIDFVEKVRWRGEHDCPHCKSTNIAARKNHAGHWKCRSCRKAHSVRIGTIFKNSNLPLHKWLHAIHKLQTSRKRVSSIQLSKELSVTGKTAWFLKQKLRRAAGTKTDAIRMTADDVEVDEVYIRGVERNQHGN